MFRAHVLIVRRAKIVLHSLWYHHAYRWLSRAQIERGLDGMHSIQPSLNLYNTIFALLTMSTCARNMQRLENKLIIKFSASIWLIFINKFKENNSQDFKINASNRLSMKERRPLCHN